MADPYRMPSLQTPVTDDKGRITQDWARLLRDYMIGLKAERAPGRVELFYLSAADLADATKFVQAGAMAGLGVGDYLGWAKCNGNNGSPTPGDTFVRLMVASAAGTTGGSDSSAHTHQVDVPSHSHADGTLAADSHTLTTNEIPAHTHPFGAAAAGVAEYPVPGAWGPYAYETGNNATTGSGHIHTISGSTAAHDEAAFASGAASATDNKPAFFSWVPLMRV